MRRGSFLVYDKWAATIAAVRQLGYAHSPPVDHSKGFRDRSTGFHSNDIESENARFKAWSRKRYGKLQLEELDLCEYAFYVNVSNAFDDVLSALAEI